MSGHPVILHPTDLSDASMPAFDMACRLATEGTRIVVLHVMEDSQVFREGYLETLNRRLEDLNPPCPGVTVEIRLTEGRVVDEILRAADDLGCELIVLGGRGKTGLYERLTGGVAEALMQRSGCPVVVIKSQPTAPAAPAEPPQQDEPHGVMVF